MKYPREISKGEDLQMKADQPTNQFRAGKDGNAWFKDSVLIWNTARLVVHWSNISTSFGIGGNLVGLVTFTHSVLVNQDSNSRP
jgi:hypothetical protein